MLYATNRFPGDGMTTQYEISFVGGYLDRAHVKAYVEGADLVKTPVTLSPGNFLGQYTIGGLAPVPVGSTLVIYRDTPKAPIVDFVNGSRFTEANLDTATRQGSFIAAEGADAVSPAGLAGVIQQVADFAAAAGAAATTAQQVADNTASALAYKNAAANSALSAATSATQSANSATAAGTAKTDAETARDSAISSATAAGNSAATATTQAGIATSKATQAANSATAAGQSETAAAASAASAASAVANANMRWPGFIRNNWTLRPDGTTNLVLQPTITNWTQLVQGGPPVDISNTVLSVSSGFPTTYYSYLLYWVYAYGTNSANELSIYGVQDNVTTSRPVYAPRRDSWVHPQTGEVCFGGFFPVSNAIADVPASRGWVSLANRQVTEGYSRLTTSVVLSGIQEYNFTEMYFLGMEGDIVEFSMSGLVTVESGAAGSTIIATWKLNNVQQSGADFRILDTLGGKTISVFGRARLATSGLHSVRGVISKSSGGGAFTLFGSSSLGAEVCQRVLVHPTTKSAI